MKIYNGGNAAVEQRYELENQISDGKNKKRDNKSRG